MVEEGLHGFGLAGEFGEAAGVDGGAVDAAVDHGDDGGGEFALGAGEAAGGVHDAVEEGAAFLEGGGVEREGEEVGGAADGGGAGLEGGKLGGGGGGGVDGGDAGGPADFGHGVGGGCHGDVGALGGGRFALHCAEAGEEADLEGDEGDELGYGDDVLGGEPVLGEGVDVGLLELTGVLGDLVAVLEQEGEAAGAGGGGFGGSLLFGGSGLGQEGAEVAGQGGFAVQEGDAEGQGGAFRGRDAAGVGGDDEFAVGALGVGADVGALGAEFGEGGAGFDGEEGFDEVRCHAPGSCGFQRPPYTVTASQATPGSGRPAMWM